MLLFFVIRLCTIREFRLLNYKVPANPGTIMGIWSKSQIPKSPFTKSPFAERPMLKRALFIGNQLGLVSVYMSVESDKKVLDWF